MAIKRRTTLRAWLWLAVSLIGAVGLLMGLQVMQPYQLRTGRGIPLTIGDLYSCDLTCNCEGSRVVGEEYLLPVSSPTPSPYYRKLVERCGPFTVDFHDNLCLNRGAPMVPTMDNNLEWHNLLTATHQACGRQCGPEIERRCGPGDWNMSALNARVFALRSLAVDEITPAHLGCKIVGSCRLPVKK